MDYSGSNKGSIPLEVLYVNTSIKGTIKKIKTFFSSYVNFTI